MIKQYKKKPVVIEAIQWNENNLEEVMKFLKSDFPYNDNTTYCMNKFSYNHESKTLFIETLEGRMKVNKYDYIIKGVQGEFYPCQKEIFEMTYERY